MPLLYPLCDEMTRPGISFIRWLVGLHSPNSLPGNTHHGRKKSRPNKVRHVDQTGLISNCDHGTHLPDPFERAYANTPLH
jgi:hypothetical protein